MLGKDCAHLKYILLSLNYKYSHTFLVCSYVFYCLVPVKAKVHASFLLNYVACVILNWNYKTCGFLSEQVPDSCCYLWNILLLEFSNFPETKISLSGELSFPRIRLEKLSAFPESLRIWINHFETQHCVNPRWILLLQEKKNPPRELCTTLESCQLPFNINQDSGDLWLASCHPPVKWVSSY